MLAVQELDRIFAMLELARARGSQRTYDVQSEHGQAGDPDQAEHDADLDDAEVKAVREGFARRKETAKNLARIESGTPGGGPKVENV